MAEQRIGVAVSAPDVASVMQNIGRVEAAGIPAVWLTTGGAGLDGLTVFAAAAERFKKVTFGTSIVPTFPRHPIVTAQQVQVLYQLAPGRIRLGIGPSHRPTTQAMFGTGFRSPLGHLKEYIQILKSLLQQGSVDFNGKYYHAHASLAAPVDVPVMASALRSASFEACGALADGAISWVCPGAYLESVALPAMRKGAAGAGRSAPPLIAHAPVCVHDNPVEVRVAVQQQLSNYPRMPFYQQMFANAGYPEAAEETWSDAMIAGTVLSGSESGVKEGLQRLLDRGATEILVSIVTAGDHREASINRTMGVLAEVSQSLNQ
ncbi:MAG TPA: LLM class flavin-dependent oxidoreductase [Dehalococcoidia bacterium]|nr:LLM class flavin-dependent oxidoreductase [Dehalococcoidia bacterium]